MPLQYSAAGGLPTTKLRTYVPWTPQQTYVFTSSGGYSFQVLAGEGAPTIDGGFAKIQVIDRPRRLGFTMPVGYDPFTLSIPIQFDCTVTNTNPSNRPTLPGIPSNTYGPKDLERDIQILEGMAGRGGSVSVDGSFVSAVGSPPVVRVYSNSPQNQSNLIPPNVQNLQWVITALTYGDTVRGRAGDRHRQIMTVGLTQWIPAPTTKRQPRSAYQVVYATQAVNTVAKIVRKFTGKTSHEDYRTVIAFSRTHGATYRTYSQTLAAGTAVFIPRDL